MYFIIKTAVLAIVLQKYWNYLLTKYYRNYIFLYA